MKKGFTLVELAMVLIVIGLLMGGAFQMMKVMQEKARATEAKQTLEAAKEAVITFAINNGYLPTDQNFTDMHLVGAGNIPIFYNSDTALQTNLCNTKTTLLNTTDINNVTTPNVGFVLAVAGENMQSQTTRVGDNITFPQWNTMTTGFPYDDLHTQVTLGELQSQADCQTNKLKIINTTLPTGTAGIPYSVSPAAIASGGKSPYTYQLTTNTSTSTFTAGTNTITWTAPTVGNYLLTFTATDSIGTVSEPKQLVLTINANPTSGTGTNTYQQCINACDAAGGSNGQITSCKAHC